MEEAFQKDQGATHLRNLYSGAGAYFGWMSDKAKPLLEPGVFMPFL